MEAKLVEIAMRIRELREILEIAPEQAAQATNTSVEEYLSCDKIICCGGSWMVKGDLVKAGEFDKIKELTAEARKLVDSIRK